LSFDTAVAALWPAWRRFPQARTKPKLHSLIALVVTIIILVLVLGLLQYVLNLFPPPGPRGNVLRVVVVIIAVLVVIGILLDIAGMPIGGGRLSARGAVA
jgi:hypothetical protein